MKVTKLGILIPVEHTPSLVFQLLAYSDFHVIVRREDYFPDFVNKVEIRGQLPSTYVFFLIFIKRASTSDMGGNVILDNFFWLINSTVSAPT